MKQLDAPSVRRVESAPVKPLQSRASPQTWVTEPAVGRPPLVFPCNRFLPLPSPPPGDEPAWYVAHIHGRRELEFRNRMIGTLADPTVVRIPLRLAERCAPREDRPGRLRHYTELVPAFPAYGFVHGDADAVYAAKATNLIWSLRPVRNVAKLLLQLRAVEDRLVDDPQVEIVRRLVPGDRYLVSDRHPVRWLRGLELFAVASMAGGTYLHLDALGSSVRYDIDRGYLEPA